MIAQIPHCTNVRIVAKTQQVTYILKHPATLTFGQTPSFEYQLLRNYVTMYWVRYCRAFLVSRVNPTAISDINSWSRVNPSANTSLRRRL